MVFSEVDSMLYQFEDVNLSCQKIINQKINEYIEILKSYYKFKDYQNLLEYISIEDNNNNDNKKEESNIEDTTSININVFKLNVVLNNNDNNNDKNTEKLNNTPKEVILAPINFCIGEDFQTEYKIDLDSMAIPMFHAHVVNGKINNNFTYAITGEEKGYVKDFITRIKLLDEKIKQLIQNYIKNCQPSSPLYSILKKNKVTEFENWSYHGIICGSLHNFINISFEKSSFEQNINGTPMYIGDEQFYDMSDILSLNSYCFVEASIYPILKLKNIFISEKIKKNKTIVSFKSKAYFTEMYFKKDTVKCTTDINNNDI